MPFCVQISVFFLIIIFRCIVSFIKENYFDFRLELDLGLFVLPVFSKSIKKLYFAKMSDTTLLHSHEDIYLHSKTPIPSVTYWAQ